MAMWKDGKTTEQVAEEVLRSYLIRCHQLVAEDYPQIAGMEPTKAADYLLQLRRTGRIKITLFDKSLSAIGCKIVDVDSAKEGGQDRSG